MSYTIDYNGQFNVESEHHNYVVIENNAGMIHIPEWKKSSFSNYIFLYSNKDSYLSHIFKNNTLRNRNGPIIPYRKDGTLLPYNKNLDRKKLEYLLKKSHIVLRNILNNLMNIDPFDKKFSHLFNHSSHNKNIVSSYIEKTKTYQIQLMYKITKYYSKCDSATNVLSKLFAVYKTHKNNYKLHEFIYAYTNKSIDVISKLKYKKALGRYVNFTEITKDIYDFNYNEKKLFETIKEYQKILKLMFESKKPKIKQSIKLTDIVIFTK